MSLMYKNDECSECENYVRLISNDKDWKCIVCGLVEKVFFLNESEGNKVWNRFQLQCGHEVHDRCYKVWCNINGCIGCVLCGKLQKNSEHKFCFYCKNFGHDPTRCPVIQHISVKEYILSLLQDYNT